MVNGQLTTSYGTDIKFILLGARIKILKILFSKLQFQHNSEEDRSGLFFDRIAQTINDTNDLKLNLQRRACANTHIKNTLTRAF